MVWNDTYVHDQVVELYESGPYAGREISFSCCGDAGVYIVDVTDKNNMFTIAALPYPGVAYCHHAWLSPDRTLLYVNDELDELEQIVTTTTTHVVNVETLENPIYVGSFTNGNPAIDHNPYGRDGFLFEANYRSGMRVYDIRIPGQEHEVAYIDTYPNNDNPNFSGAWGVYPGLPSRSILVSDINRGLFVVQFTAAGIPEWNSQRTLALAGYPNPARGPMNLSFWMQSQGAVDLSLYDVAGRRIASLLSGPTSVGPHAVAWDPRSVEAAPGVYFAVLTTPQGEARQRVVVLK
jgi:hypothetical protein